MLIRVEEKVWLPRLWQVERTPRLGATTGDSLGPWGRLDETRVVVVERAGSEMSPLWTAGTPA
jgi:hypothetical protein